MEEIIEEAFDELLAEFKRSSVHLETRDAYGTEVELPHLAKWKRGETSSGYRSGVRRSVNMLPQGGPCDG